MVLLLHTAICVLQARILARWLQPLPCIATNAILGFTAPALGWMTRIWPVLDAKQEPTAVVPVPPVRQLASSVLKGRIHTRACPTVPSVFKDHMAQVLA